MEWNEYPKKRPADEVKEYLIIDEKGNERVLEWYEGACFIHGIGGGFWNDEDGNEVFDVLKWREIK